VPIGRVALSVDALPAIVPVTFKLIGDSIVFGATAGSRLARATANSIVAFLADSYDLDSRSGWWVEVLGPASWIIDPAELSQLRGELTEPWATATGLTMRCASNSPTSKDAASIGSSRKVRDV